MALRLMHSRSSLVECKEVGLRTVEVDLCLFILTCQAITTTDLIPSGKMEFTADANQSSPKAEEDSETIREDLDSLIIIPSEEEIPSEEMTTDTQQTDPEKMGLEEMKSEDIREDLDSLIIIPSEEEILSEETTTDTLQTDPEKMGLEAISVARGLTITEDIIGTMAVTLTMKEHLTPQIGGIGVL